MKRENKIKSTVNDLDNMAEVEVKMFEFTISLLGATIQDGGMRERSNIIQVLEPVLQ